MIQWAPQILHWKSGLSVRQLVLILVTLVWGSTFVVVKTAVHSTSPLGFLAVRFAIATAVLLPWALLDRRPVAWKPSLWAGLWLFLAFYSQTLGLVYTGPDRAAFLTALSVLLVPIGDRWVFGRRLSWRAWASGGLALLGLGLFLSPHGGLNRGDFLILGTAVAVAVQVIITETLPAGASRIRFATVEMGVTALLAALFAGFRPAPVWTADTALAAVYTGVLASAVAYALQAWAQRRLSGFQTALIFTLEPVFATLIGVWWDKRTVTAAQVIGGLVMLAALVWHELAGASESPRNPASHPPSP